MSSIWSPELPMQTTEYSETSRFGIGYGRWYLVSLVHDHLDAATSDWHVILQSVYGEGEPWIVNFNIQTPKEVLARKLYQQIVITWPLASDLLAGEWDPSRESQVSEALLLALPGDSSAGNSI